MLWSSSFSPDDDDQSILIETLSCNPPVLFRTNYYSIENVTWCHRKWSLLILFTMQSYKSYPFCLLFYYYLLFASSSRCVVRLIGTHRASFFYLEALDYKHVHVLANNAHSCIPCWGIPRRLTLLLRTAVNVGLTYYSGEKWLLQ